MVCTKLRNALESFYVIPAIFVIAVLGRMFNIIHITLPLISMVIVCILVFCDDVKNVLALIFYAPFYIKDLNMNNMPTVYAIVILAVVISLLSFIVRRFIKLKKQNAVIKGKLYVPLIIVTIAYILGGIAYDFKFTSFMAIIIFSIATFVFYFIALNCIDDVGTFMSKVFVAGGILVGFMVFYENYVNYGGLRYIFSSSKYTVVGAENVNVAALFLLLGIFGAFNLGYKTKNDGNWLLVASIFYAIIIVTYCRMMVALGALSLICLSILTLKNSPDKKRYSIFLLALLLVVLGIVIAFWGILVQMLDILTGKQGLGGREILWPWCFEQFKNNPIFGIGFKITETVPMMGAGAGNYVLAHNTIIQWLASLGIIGTLLMFTYVFVKYKILFKDFSGKGLILRLLIIFIAINGITDQAPQMDPFIYNIVIVIMAWIESVTWHKTKKEIEYEKN